MGQCLPCSLVLTKSSGCRQSVDTIPAVNPATVSTKDADRPSWPVMDLSSPAAVGLVLIGLVVCEFKDVAVIDGK